MQEERLFTRPFMLLLGGHFLQGLGWTSMLLLPMYMEALGADRGQIGTVMAWGGVGGLAILPFAGPALDRIGRRPTLVAGSLATVVGLLGLGFVDELSPLLWVMRFIAGIGTGSLFAGYFAYVSDFIPASRRTEGIALFGISGLLPLMVNPFAEQMVSDPLALRWVFPIASIGVLLSIPFILATPETKPKGPSTGRHGWLSAIVAPGLRPVWVANLTFASAVAVFMAFGAVAAAGAGMERPAMMWVPYALGAIVVRLVGAKLPDRLGAQNIVAPSIALYALGMLTLTMVTSDTGFLIAATLCGIGHGYCFPVIASQVVGRSPLHQRGAAMALSTGIWEGSAIAAQPIFGAIADQHGDGWCFIAAASLCLVGICLWLLLESRRRS